MTGDNLLMKLLIILYNLALLTPEENSMRILFFQVEVPFSQILTKDLIGRFKTELMIDLNNTNSLLAKHPSQLRSMLAKIWSRDTQSGLEVVF